MPNAAMLSYVLGAVVMRGARDPCRREQLRLDKFYDCPLVAPAMAES